MKKSLGASRAIAAVALAGALAIGATMLGISSLRAAEPAVAIPAPSYDPAATGTSETAILAGGCFWGMQAVFEHVIGVKRVIAGYTGGSLANPTYEQVSSETTGHAEAVEITFDPTEISYGRLLQVYFSVAHNPTQLNYQGPDRGTSYRSNIFYVNDAQKKSAEAYISQLARAGSFSKPIVTRVDQFEVFYRAEDYHQDYYLAHPNQPYIVINDAPKVENLKRLLPQLYRGDPVTVTQSG